MGKSRARKKTKIEKEIAALFSEGALSEKCDQSLRLMAARELNLYFAPVPWRILLPNAKALSGFSETLRLAVYDLHANLTALSRVLPVETVLTFEIDEGRLPEPRRQTKFSKFNKG